ncbi:MAG: FAD-dependent oxidoreductase [Desulfobacterales bacterium]|nr:FAD-dependent oxidoreductase [Desulfobacterales bacterium]
MTISSNDLDPGFKFEIANVQGNELIKHCFTCGACIAACPVSNACSEYDPRKIIHMISLGLKERVLSSENIWHCSHCESCRFSCPQGVRLSKVMDALQTIAVRDNYVASDTFEKFGTAPCKAACPAHISIQGFIGMITEGRYKDGLKLIKEEMPFPSICGRICHHPCEMKCNRGKIDEPVAIEYLKRFLADRGLSEDIGYVPETEEKKDEKIAIIGAGPAGLSAAYFLAIKGYPVTVFERLPVAGGMMAVGIPAYRLPRDILRNEIKTITDMGVEIKTGVTFGKDITIESLRKEGYKAFFIAVGRHASCGLNVKGENLEGIIHGINFLKDISLKGKVSVGERAIVIGGGNVAIDVALTALRSGAKDVQIVCLEGRDEMHAWDYEIKDALDEGIAIINNWGPRRFIGKNGHVKSIEFKRCTAVLDANGRFNPQYDESEVMTLEADTVLLSIGQACDMSFAKGVPDFEVSPMGPVVKDPFTLETNIPGIFVGGDASYGPRSVVKAVASGKDAAISIDRYLKGEDLRAGRPLEWKGIELEPKDVEHLDRQQMQRLSIAQRRNSFEEMDLGFSEQQARLEAGRCLKICGTQSKVIYRFPDK